MNNAGMKLECIRCGKKSSLSAWNKKTREQCFTREQLRDYIQLYDTRAFKKETEVCYMCPRCGKWVEGYKLDPTASDEVKYGLGEGEVEE